MKPLSGPLPEGLSGVARYMQLASLLRHQIESGAWPPGHRLPTVQQMAIDMGLARVTVRQAYGLLVEAGLLESRRGRGTHVCRQLPARTNTALYTAINQPLLDMQGLEITVLGVTRDARLPLELAPVPGMLGADAYVRLRKIHAHEGVPYSMIDLYVAQENFDGLPAGSEGSARMARLLLEHGRQGMGKLQQRVTVLPADHEQATLLQYPFAAPIARVLRRVSNLNHVMVYAGVFLYRGDRFALDMTVPAEVLFKHPEIAVPGPPG